MLEKCFRKVEIDRLEKIGNFTWSVLMEYEETKFIRFSTISEFFAEFINQKDVHIQLFLFSVLLQLIMGFFMCPII